MLRVGGRARSSTRSDSTIVASEPTTRDPPRRLHRRDARPVVRALDVEHLGHAGAHLEVRGGLAGAEVALGQQRPGRGRREQRGEADRAGRRVAQQARRVRVLVRAVEALQPRLRAGRRGERGALAGHARARRALERRAVGEAVVARAQLDPQVGVALLEAAARAGSRGGGARAACRRACGTSRTASRGRVPVSVKPIGRQRVAVPSPIADESTCVPRRLNLATTGASARLKRTFADSRPSGDSSRQMRCFFAASAGAGTASRPAAKASSTAER